jgi:hypothetical protein
LFNFHYYSICCFLVSFNLIFFLCTFISQFNNTCRCDSSSPRVQCTFDNRGWAECNKGRETQLDDPRCNYYIPSTSSQCDNDLSFMQMALPAGERFDNTVCVGFDCSTSLFVVFLVLLYRSAMEYSFLVSLFPL